MLNSFKYYLKNDYLIFEDKKEYKKVAYNLKNLPVILYYWEDLSFSGYSIFKEKVENGEIINFFKKGINYIIFKEKSIIVSDEEIFFKLLSIFEKYSKNINFDKGN